MKILGLFLFLLAAGVNQSLAQGENFKKSMTAAMLKDIKASMDNDNFDPLYFLENVVPTCKALMYVKWNVTTKFLEESFDLMNQNSFGRDSSTFRRKKRVPRRIVVRDPSSDRKIGQGTSSENRMARMVKDNEYCYPCCARPYCHEPYCSAQGTPC